MSTSNPSSSILFLIGCSNAKADGGREYWPDAATVPDGLKGKWRRSLLDARARLQRLVVSEDVTRSGRLLKDLPYNRCLRPGPDFTGVFSRTGEYLPARTRYSGRLYKRVNAEVWANRRHHVLIFSSLYGVLLPEEPIQRYSLHLGDDSRIAEVWKREELATRVVLEYASEHGIRRIFSGLGEDLYRGVFSWDVVAGRKMEVFHVFGEQNAGPGALPAIGAWLGSALLADESELLRIDSSVRVETEVEPLAFSDTVTPPPGCPDESQLLIGEIQKYYGPLLRDSARAIEAHIGRDRWERLGQRGDSREFAVSGLALWRLSRNVGADLSPVCVQVAKAVETVLLEVVREAAKAGAGLCTEHCATRSYGELVRAHQRHRSLSLDWTASLLEDVQRGEGPDGVLRAVRKTKAGRPALQRLAKEIRHVAAFRNPRAHTARANAVTAERCVESVLGDVEGTSGTRADGLLATLIDAIA